MDALKPRSSHRLALVAAVFAAAALTPSLVLATAAPIHGVVPDGVRHAFEDGLFDLPARPAGLATSVAPPVWRLPIVLVSFADDTLTHGAADFDRELFDTTHAVPTGSMFDYYQWASNGRLRVSGRVVATVRLPETQAYYAGHNAGLNVTGTPQNSLGYVRDALAGCESAVNWPEFDLDHDGYVDMLWVVHAGVGAEAAGPEHLWTITTRMSGSWLNAGPYLTHVPVAPGSPGTMMRLDRFTVLPELSPFHPGGLNEIGTFCHEFGHTLGLPDLYDVLHRANTGPGNWSLMSSGSYGGNGYTPESPTHFGAWPLQFLGWDQTRRPTRDTTLSLTPLPDSHEIVDFWFEGESSPEHFLVENRRRIGFDQSLIQEGLIVYHVDENVIGRRLLQNGINSGDQPGLRLVEADGHNDLVVGQNRADVNDPFPGGLQVQRFDDTTSPNTHTFTDLSTQVALEDFVVGPRNVQFRIEVRAPGWMAVEDHTDPDYAPRLLSGSASVSGTDRAGTGYLVASEYRNGRPAVVLRSSLAWDAPFVVSQSSGAALDPTLAVTPGGDLAIVWSDTRDGRAKLYFRSRVRGGWTAERLLLSRPGSCRSPALGADAKGGLSLAFQYLEGDSVQIQLMRFTYFSPFGQPIRVVGAPQRPENPSVAVAPDGGTIVAWQDRTPPQRVWFARYHPDSGLKARLPLTSPTTASQDGYSMLLTPDGALHVAWEESSAGLNQLLYQRRVGVGFLNPDELLASSGLAIQHPRLVGGTEGVVHLVYETANPPTEGVRYRRWRPGRGWDALSTDLLTPSILSGARPVALPLPEGDVSVVFTGEQDQRSRLLVRNRVQNPRVSDAPGPEPTPSRAAGGLMLGPNPLRAGQTLRAWTIAAVGALSSGAASSGSPSLEVFDASGRRVASVATLRVGSRLEARVPGGSTSSWPAGMYFARLRGSRSERARITVVR
jgi:M6 family metalloprotease-like protein